uniref:Uncharacterized protein n=1 Tax=Steinernema glaseri TaxID=37863 RepID=A0A1I8AT50_9BILA
MNECFLAPPVKGPFDGTFNCRFSSAKPWYGFVELRVIRSNKSEFYPYIHLHPTASRPNVMDRCSRHSPRLTMNLLYLLLFLQQNAGSDLRSLFRKSLVSDRITIATQKMEAKH